MAPNYLSEIVNRDFSRISTQNRVINYLVKPLSFEVKTAQSLIIMVRRLRMKELYENEQKQQQQELNAMGKSTYPMSVCEHDRWCYEAY
ncbi:uncharacterized protein LOC115634296 [Scaptodrosophila lebanonensis]|uniref:Uncharacterized protein LOC115634296 n=1 Tax=Drosophila lebanonensis TaxID=7225 RepID=A0A6J2UHK6_DROLE|nr:uncharacterized protein LOC115634296 [Scaptodrosophila lebanonensis]